MKVDPVYYDQMNIIIRNELDYIETAISKVAYSKRYFVRQLPTITIKPLSTSYKHTLIVYVELVEKLEASGYRVSVTKKNGRYKSLLIEWGDNDDDRLDITKLESILDTKLPEAKIEPRKELPRSSYAARK